MATIGSTVSETSSAKSRGSGTKLNGGDENVARDSDESITDTARHVADSVAGAAGEVTARIPEVAATTRSAFGEANRMVHRGSDTTLMLVGAASIGFAVGLLVGGANRLLVILSLIPAGLIGATMVERMDGGGASMVEIEGGGFMQEP